MNSDCIHDYLRAIELIPESRTINLVGDIGNGDATRLEKQFLALQEDDADVLFSVDCPGGHCAAGMKLHFLFQTSRCRVLGRVDGRAHSAGFMALQGCEFRVATRRSTLGIHNPEFYSINTPMKYDSTEEEYVERQRATFRRVHPGLVKSQKMTVDILLGRIPPERTEELTELLKGERRMEPEEAISWGFLDAIID